jgi:hypothetical protein
MLDRSTEAIYPLGMDTLEYIQKVTAKITESFEAGEEKTWSERVKDAGDAVMDEENE